MTKTEKNIVLINKFTNHKIEYRVYTRTNGNQTTYIMSIDGDKYTTKNWQQTEARHRLADILQEVIGDED